MLLCLDWFDCKINNEFEAVQSDAWGKCETGGNGKKVKEREERKKRYNKAYTDTI